MAIASPLLCGYDLKKFKGLLISIACDCELEFSEVNHMVSILAKAVDEDADIIYGYPMPCALKKKSQNCNVRVSIIATRFEQS